MKTKLWQNSPAGPILCMRTPPERAWIFLKRIRWAALLLNQAGMKSNYKPRYVPVLMRKLRESAAVLAIEFLDSPTQQ